MNIISPAVLSASYTAAKRTLSQIAAQMPVEEVFEVAKESRIKLGLLSI